MPGEPLCIGCNSASVSHVLSPGAGWGCISSLQNTQDRALFPFLSAWLKKAESQKY